MAPDNERAARRRYLARLEFARRRFPQWRRGCSKYEAAFDAAATELAAALAAIERAAESGAA